MTSASPRSMAAAAVVMACRPEAQARVTVIASTDGGSRRSSAISRPTLGAVPGRMTPPQTMPSISLRGMPVRSSSAPTAATPRPMVSTLMSWPNALTNGVRTPPTMTRGATTPRFAAVARSFSWPCSSTPLGAQAPMRAPPQSRMICPVTPCAPGLARNVTSSPMSRGRPPCPSADSRRPTSRIMTGIAAVSRVSMKPGAMALTVMPRAGQLRRQRAHEADDARLRRRVVGLAHVAGDARHRRQADDAPAVAQRAALGASTSVMRATDAEVDVDRLVPQLRLHLGQRLVARDAGVVHDDVDAAEALLELGARSWPAPRDR